MSNEKVSTEEFEQGELIEVSQTEGFEHFHEAYFIADLSSVSYYSEKCSPIICVVKREGLLLTAKYARKLKKVKLIINGQTYEVTQEEYDNYESALKAVVSS